MVAVSVAVSRSADRLDQFLDGDDAQENGESILEASEEGQLPPLGVSPPLADVVPPDFVPKVGER